LPHDLMMSILHYLQYSYLSHLATCSNSMKKLGNRIKDSAEFAHRKSVYINDSPTKHLLERMIDFSLVYLSSIVTIDLTKQWYNDLCWLFHNELRQLILPVLEVLRISSSHRF